MKCLFKILGIFVAYFCHAQQTLPLNTSLVDIPNNAYIKDTNNELIPYVGTYKANFNGNEIILYISKEDNKLEKRSTKQFYRDALVVKYTVKNSSGSILQDTQNNNTYNIELYSIDTDPTENTITFFYSGTNCSVGWGRIMLKKISPTQLSWSIVLTIL